MSNNKEKLFTEFTAPTTQEWLDKLFPGSKVNKIVGGLVPVSSTLKSYILDRFALVGDAAHHTNPLTGGGIAAAMRAGRYCANTVHQGLECGNLSKAFLKAYENRCYLQFGSTHNFEFKFRKFLQRPSDYRKNLLPRLTFYGFRPVFVPKKYLKNPEMPLI